MAGYIGKSLAIGGNAVDAYSKTQTDATYLKLAGGLMTGGVRQGVLSVSANTTITASHPNVILVTTSTNTITLTLPSASTVGGQVYRFIKVDTGGAGVGTALTGRVRIARAGSDTMGINANTAMELWFQDNYIDLMSDGSSRWIVMSTEMFIIPADRRITNWLPPGNSAVSWTPVNYATEDRVPEGTSEINLFGICRWVSDGSGNVAILHMRKNGDTANNDAQIRAASFQYTALANAKTVETSFYHPIQVDIARIFEYTWFASYETGRFYADGRGYRLG